MQDDFKDWGRWWVTFEGLDSYKTYYSLVKLKANKSQPSVDRVLAKCRQSNDRLVVVLSRLSTNTRVGRNSSNCPLISQSSVGRVWIDCRSRYWLIIDGVVDWDVDQHTTTEAFSTHDPVSLIHSNWKSSKNQSYWKTLIP